jgi:hypothetical protein
MLYSLMVANLAAACTVSVAIPLKPVAISVATMVEVPAVTPSAMPLSARRQRVSRVMGYISINLLAVE